MKIILTIWLLSFSFILAQVTQIAVITNPEIGPQANAMNLIEAVENINKQKSINQVVVIGNITANGKIDEFIWAQDILDGLTVPYFVVGGEKDYLFSEEKGSEITLLWGDNKQAVDFQNYSLISINSFVPEFPSKNFINGETLNWLEKRFSSSKISRLLTFSFRPIQGSENAYQFFESTLDKKIFSFVGKEDDSFKNRSIFEGLYLNRKDGWGYLIVSTNRDSIQIKKILSEEIKKKVKPEIETASFSKPFVRELKEQISFVSAGSKMWSVETKKTKLTYSINDVDKIYSAFRNGSILCTDYNGKEIWRHETNKKISNAPIADRDLLIIASDDGDIITLNKQNGNPHQIIGTGENITSGISVIEIEEQRTIKKAVVFGTAYGKLFCYDLFSLDPLWIEQVSDIGSEEHIVSVILSSDNKIFFYDNRGTLYCRSAANGLLIWKIEATEAGWKVGKKLVTSVNTNKMIIKENDLILADDSGNLFCADALLGIIKWNLKSIYANGIMRTNRKQELLLPTTKSKIVIFSTKTGKVKTEIDLPIDRSNEAITDLQVINGNILISFSDGWVYKIGATQKAAKFFRGGFAPVISLVGINGKCFVTDYDGKLTLLKLSP